MIYLFDDGSVESKLLQHEHKDHEIKVIKTEYKPDDILSYIEQIPEAKDADNPTVIHLHFTRQDFLEHDINAQKNKLTADHPNLRIFFAYEFMDKEHAMERAVMVGAEPKIQQIEEEDSLGSGVSMEPEPEPTKETETKSNKTKKSK